MLTYWLWACLWLVLDNEKDEIQVQASKYLCPGPCSLAALWNPETIMWRSSTFWRMREHGEPSWPVLFEVPPRYTSRPTVTQLSKAVQDHLVTSQASQEQKNHWAKPKMRTKCVRFKATMFWGGLLHSRS